MKRYIQAKVVEDEDQCYQPNVFNKEEVNRILEDLLHEIEKKFYKRYKAAKYNFDNVHFDDYYMSATIHVTNGDKDIINKKFEFQPYSDYWDETDYQQHVQTSIQKFIRNI